MNRQTQDLDIDAAEIYNVKLTKQPGFGFKKKNKNKKAGHNKNSSTSSDIQK